MENELTISDTIIVLRDYSCVCAIDDLARVINDVLHLDSGAEFRKCATGN